MNTEHTETRKRTQETQRVFDKDVSLVYMDLDTFDNGDVRLEINWIEQWLMINLNRRAAQELLLILSKHLMTHEHFHKLEKTPCGK